MPSIVTDILQTRMELLGLPLYQSGLAGASNSLKALSAEEAKLGRAKGIGMAAGIAATALAGGLVKAVQAAGEMQQVETGFTTMLGGIDQAKAKIAELQEFAKKTPFDFGQSAKAAQQLLAMGIEANDLIPTMQAVGEAVSAAGGSTETYLRALRAIGQVQTKGRLQAEELLQLAEAGVNVSKIYKGLGLTADQMRNIGNQGVPAAKALSVIRQVFSEEFGGAMEAQSKTLVGATSNLKDGLNQLATAIGTPFLAPLTGAVNGINGLLTSLNSLSPQVKGAAGVVAGVLTVGLGVVAVKAALVARTLAKIIAENVMLTNESLKSGTAATAQGTAIATRLNPALERQLQLTQQLNIAQGGRAGAGFPTAGLPPTAGTSTTGRASLPPPSYTAPGTPVGTKAGRWFPKLGGLGSLGGFAATIGLGAAAAGAKEGKGREELEGATTGAGLGALAGPVGAVVGGALGAGAAFIGKGLGQIVGEEEAKRFQAAELVNPNRQGERRAAGDASLIDELRAQTRLLADIRDKGGTLPTSRVPLAYQSQMLDLGKALGI